MSLDTCVTAKLGSLTEVSKVTTLMPRCAACSSGAWSASASVAATMIASGLRATAAFTIGICEAGSYFGGACCVIDTPSFFGLLLGTQPDRVEEVVSGDSRE